LLCNGPVNSQMKNELMYIRYLNACMVHKLWHHASVCRYTMHASPPLVDLCRFVPRMASSITALPTTVHLIPHPSASPLICLKMLFLPSRLSVSGPLLHYYLLSGIPWQVHGSFKFSISACAEHSYLCFHQSGVFINQVQVR